MSYIELFVIAVSLSFDTFAVSLAGGLALTDITNAGRGRIALSFAFFQTLFLFAGWGVGAGFLHIISAYDHWIASGILFFIGGRMLFSKSGQESKIDLSNRKQLTMLSIATSIDALAVGISIAMVSISAWKFAFMLLMTVFSTLMASLSGLIGGSKFSGRFEDKASFAGGLVLLAIAVKILVEHLS